MEGIRYEPIPPTIVDQRWTREGHFILYFVPTDSVSTASQGKDWVLSSAPESLLPHLLTQARVK